MKTEHPYKPHSRCKYPFIADSINYCWAWATSIDEKRFNEKTKDDFIKNYCKECEFFKKI